MSYIAIAKFLPKGVREGYGNLLIYSGVKVPGERFLGFTVIFGLLLSLAIAFLVMVFMGIGTDVALTVFLFCYMLFEGGIYMWLWFRVDSRSKFVERILPDALQIMSMNIRAGLTTERALILTARPEFGVLEKELKRAGKEIMAGRDLKESMLGISKRVKSRQLETTLKMVVDGIDSGGELASLLEQTSSDIQNTQLMEKEVRASVLMYVIFIFFAVGMGAPVIFGISTHLVQVLTEQMGQFDDVNIPDYDEISSSGITPFGGFSAGSTLQGASSVSIDPDFLVMYAMLSLSITSFFGGLVIGVIKDGSEKQGIRYVPILLGLSMALFFVTRFIAATMFAI
jgi:pilus assembly protein TadC